MRTIGIKKKFIGLFVMGLLSLCLTTRNAKIHVFTMEDSVCFKTK